MRRSAGSLSRLLATRTGAVVPANAPGRDGITELQAEALTRLLSADGGASRAEYDGTTFRVEGIVVETSKRHAEPAYLTLQGHAEGESRYQVHCVLGSKERDSIHGVEIGHRVRVLGEYRVPDSEAGLVVTLTGCKLVR